MSKPIISSILKRENRIGKENAISTEELSIRLGLDSRAIRKQVADERLEGSLIIGGNGYYLPSQLEEIDHFINKVLSSIKSQRASIEPSIKFLREYKEREREKGSGQLRFDDGGRVVDRIDPKPDPIPDRYPAYNEEVRS